MIIHFKHQMLTAKLTSEHDDKQDKFGNFFVDFPFYEAIFRYHQYTMFVSLMIRYARALLQAADKQVQGVPKISFNVSISLVLCRFNDHATFMCTCT
jgi:hypothetical protein